MHTFDWLVIFAKESLHIQSSLSIFSSFLFSTFAAVSSPSSLCFIPAYFFRKKHVSFVNFPCVWWLCCRCSFYIRIEEFASFNYVTNFIMTTLSEPYLLWQHIHIANKNWYTHRYFLYFSHKNHGSSHHASVCKMRTWFNLASF